MNTSKDAVADRDRNGGLRLYSSQAIVLLVLLVIAFPGFFFQGEVLSPADILFQSKPWSEQAPSDWSGPSNRLMPDVVTAFYPYYALVKQELEAGRWPLWNHYELAGMPLMANAQTAVFYPPRLVHMFFDVPVANSLYILFKFWLCGMTAFICARGLRMSAAAARFASIGWMLCGYNQAWAYWSLPDVSAWLPILFLGTERVLESRERQGGALVALAGSMMLFAGHPETAFTMAFGAGIYFLFRVTALFAEPRRATRAVAVMAVAWGVALLIASVQIVPLVEYIRQSTTYVLRNRGTSEPSLLAGSFVSLWVPRFYGMFMDRNYWGWGVINSNVMIMMYFGLPVWAMLWLGGAPVRVSAGRARYWSLLGTTIVCCLLAVNLTELRWINSVPPFSSTVKFYHVAFPVFAMVILGARGLDCWLRKPRDWRSLAPLIPAVLIPAVFIAALYAFESQVMAMEKTGAYVQRQIVYAAGFGVAVLAVCATSCLDRRARVFPILLLGLLAFDLLFAARNMNPTMRKRDVFPPTELTAYLQSLGAPCRMGLAEGGVPSGTFAPYGIEDWLGYDGLYPARVPRFQKELGEDVWKAAEPLYSNMYYLNDPDLPPIFPLKKQPERFEFVRELDGLEIYRNKPALPRARLVGGLRTFSTETELFKAMRSSEFDPTREVYVLQNDLPGNPPALEPDAPQGSVSIREYSSPRVVMQVDAERDTVLVLSDAYYGGWRATIDGVPSAYFPVYYAFRGIFVPKGAHTVVYEYWPRSFQAGLGISSATLCALLGVAAFILSRRRSIAARF